LQIILVSCLSKSVLIKYLETLLGLNVKSIEANFFYGFIFYFLSLINWHVLQSEEKETDPKSRQLFLLR
jgi:hypothetical protein